MKKVVLIKVLGIFILYGCSKKILLPIEKGEVLDKGSPKLISGYYFYIKPKYKYEIQASENGIVEHVLITDSTTSVIIKGKYEIYYGNLKESYVKKGFKIKKGQAIGKLFDITTPEFDLLLMMSIKKKHKTITNPSVFYDNGR